MSLFAYSTPIVENHIMKELLWYEGDDGPKEYVATANAPQNFCTGTLLWILMFHRVFGLRVPTLLGFANQPSLNDPIKIWSNSAWWTKSSVRFLLPIAGETILLKSGLISFCSGLLETGVL